MAKHTGKLKKVYRGLEITDLTNPILLFIKFGEIRKKLIANNLLLTYTYNLDSTINTVFL